MGGKSRDVLSDLRALRIDLERMAGKRKIELDVEVRRKLARLGLTYQEARAWIQSEPDFDIPLKRPRDKLTPYLGG